MKKRITFLFLLILVACKQQTREAPVKETKIIPETANSIRKYPEALQKVFDTHGGLDLWKKQRTLEYTMTRDGNPETHITDLRTRHDLIYTDAYRIGFDGRPWVLDIDKVFKRNPEFYHNLFFYFYAMPFILADDGINYGETADLEFEGKSYPGIEITYNEGVGTSPKDEYYIHYDPETYEMTWLGYTVTYRTGEDSDIIKWIRYDDWTSIDGLQLPQSFSWYGYEGRNIKDLRNTVVFEKISLSKEPQTAAFYAKPEMGEYFEKPAEK